jgi:malonyl CoA-acyl carrier protein transacylase
LRVNTELRPWTETVDGVRRAGASAFGFGGTNFHVVMEEHIPGRLTGNGKRSVSVGDIPVTTSAPKAPLRGALVAGADSADALIDRLRAVRREAELGRSPAMAAPAEKDLRAPERVAVDYGSLSELMEKCAKSIKALEANDLSLWKALRAQGIFRGHGPAPKVAFLYTGQGSQYVNMLRGLRKAEPIVAETFAEADRTMTPFLGTTLSSLIFVDPTDAAAVATAEEGLRQTAITQPAVLATDLALTRLLEAFGIRPDFTMGHSLGEYGALVASGALRFANALEAVSARGREMTRVAMADNGKMAAVFARLSDIERVLKTIDGYVVVANVNSDKQAVIGGASRAVEQAIEAFQRAGVNVVPLPVSHAFHTSIVEPAARPLRETLERLGLCPPRIPIVANVNGQFYPSDPNARTAMLDILARQIASPVQFTEGLRTLYAAGARVFVEVGPKKALHGFVEDVLGDREDVLPLFTNHPKLEDPTAFNQALCGLYAAGLGAGKRDKEAVTELRRVPSSAPFQPVVITGASVGLPGVDHIFDDRNVERILKGEQFIDVISTRHRKAILDKHITRLVKSENGGPVFEEIRHPSDVLKLAARGNAFDLHTEFGVPDERIPALDRVTALAIAAGIDALRDAGIPLVLRHKTTTKGTRLPDRWMLPESLRDETGVIFASVFPGYDSFADEQERYYMDRSRREQLQILEDLRACVVDGQAPVAREMDRRIEELRRAVEQTPYRFDRRFLFRVLSMGHSQFAELIGARGPNTQVNAACASTTHALGLAEDWIRAGRCRRVVIVSADDITSDHMIEWFGAGFLATGAAATEDVVEEVALPFDRRRLGMVIGMGAAALVVECPEAAAARGLRPIAELLSAVTANSAYHGTRLDVDHIRTVMDALLRQAEERAGIRREEIAPATVFVSHETYTPARGGSASAEVQALRHVFGAGADRVVIANTKGFTGHAMGAGIEDVVAVKALETGIVPPVANFRDVDPELGPLNLSRGGSYPIEYALRLGAGFGSQISMTLARRLPGVGPRPYPDRLGYAYRVDEAKWREWIGQVGEGGHEVEVKSRTLRIRPPAGEAREVVKEQVSTPVVRPAAPVVKPSPAPAPIAPAREMVAEEVLNLVAEKTGYPKDMLDVELDLEADLGVDTVKQAEMFAAIRERYGIARDPDLKLRNFPTLAKVIQFVRERRPAVAQPPAVVEPAPKVTLSPTPLPAGEILRDEVLELVATKTGYPKDMLDLDLDLEADLGVDTVKQAEMFAAIRERYGIARDPDLKLRDFPTLAKVIQFVRDRLPQTAQAPPAPPPTVGDTLRDEILELVATKTGYPKDMLDPDLDLEADLGVDTVKQAEMFAAIRERYGIPRDPDLKLRDFPTIGHVVRFARERATSRAGAPSHEPPAEKPRAAAFDAADRLARRVPSPVLRPPLEYCKPTGVTLGPGKRVLIMPDHGGVAGKLTQQLSALGVEVGGLDADAAPGSIDGVFWLPALDDEGDWFQMTADEWRRATDIRIKSLHHTMRALCKETRTAPVFLIAATRMGGLHGYDETGAMAPMGGAVTGFTKAYKREQPDALAKAVDFEVSRNSDEIAAILIDEALRDPGAVEIGHARTLRWTIALQETTAVASTNSLGGETVFAITGAAGGIVSAITADLAAGSGGVFHLMDVIGEPSPQDPDVQKYGVDREALKRDLFARIQERGERATPAMVERELAAIERSHAALGAMQAVRAAGGAAYYHQVDLTDAGVVKRVIDQIRERSERIDVLLHAAGVDRSHSLADKTEREFDLVYDVKATGLFHLLHAAGDMPIGTLIAFSSIAGRFGNVGQTDYSAANDLMCKAVSSLRRLRPAMRGIAIDWTAWGDIGMASRGSIPKVMEMAGIEMLSPAAGIPWIRRELTTSNERGEVVVAGRLGLLEKAVDETGGLAENAFAPGPMTAGTAKIDAGGRLTIETPLDPGQQPFLFDHMIEGSAVLPGVMGIEGFAESALALAPGHLVEAVEDVEFHAPFKFYRGEPRAVTLEAVLRPDDDDVAATCELKGKRLLPNQVEPQVSTHFTGRVRLRRGAEVVPTLWEPIQPVGNLVELPEIYAVYFHGSAYRVLQRVWWTEEQTVGEMAVDLPANHYPSHLPLATDPRLLELCFQTAGIWEMAVMGRMGLPSRVKRVQWHAVEARDDGDRLYALVTPHPAEGAFDAEVIDSAGRRLLTLVGYRTVALYEAAELKNAFAGHVVIA